MLIGHNPRESLPPVGPFSWGLEVASPARRVLHIAGQIGADGLGRVGEGFLEQARLTWANLGAVLASAGMSPANLVRTGIYVAQRAGLTPDLVDGFNVLRMGFLGEHRPASTMLYVPALMNPAWLIEIDGIAVEL
jgi:enamine deaminase RidA (YjgF/YER057c/UK114 family)